MDSALLIKYLSTQEKKPLVEDDNIEKFNMVSENINIIGLIISVAIGGYAAYLSYECNTKHNMSEPIKIVYAILAYIFGLIYLIYYLLFRGDYCSTS